MTTSSNVILRAIEPDDLDLLYNVENDRTLWQLGNTNEPYSKELLRNYILTTTGDIYADKQLRLIIELESASARSIIGIADLTRFDPRNARAEIGIVILDSFRHKGFASQVLCRLSAYAKNLLHLHQLYAVIPEGNTASLRLFDKCGFTRCATLRDWLFGNTGFEQAVVVQKIL
ncbi:MAG: GNAT family N-acetyltransferase [Prevotella sp.]|nr:GNAT family N-acetyltransferase [Prevotella sp.]